MTNFEQIPFLILGCIMKKIWLIGLLCCSPGVQAQNSALLASSGAAIFTASLSKQEKPQQVSITFTNNQAVIKTKNTVYRNQYYVQKYRTRYQYGLNRQGSPASASVLDLKAGDGRFVAIWDAVHKADSLGAELKQILSASTEAEMGIIIDGDQKYLGLERFNTRTEEGGWVFMKAGTIARLFTSDVFSVFYPLRKSVNTDSLKRCLGSKECLDSTLEHFIAGDQRTVIIQSFNHVFNIPYGYHYTCYKVTGKKTFVDSIVSVLGEWRLTGNDLHKKYLLHDLILLKKYTNQNGKLVEDDRAAIVLDMLQERQYNLSISSGRQQKVTMDKAWSFSKEQADAYLKDPSATTFHTGQEVKAVLPRYSVQVASDILELVHEGRQTPVMLPPFMLFFLNPHLKPY